MKAGKFLLPIIILIAATAYFSIFIVKEINQAIVQPNNLRKNILLL